MSEMMALNGSKFFCMFREGQGVYFQIDLCILHLGYYKTCKSG